MCVCVCVCLCVCVFQLVVLLCWSLSGFELLGGATGEGGSSPLVHLRLEDAELADVSRYDAIARVAKEHGALMSVMSYNVLETNPPPTSIRLSVSAAHSEKQIDDCVRAIQIAFKIT